LLGLNEKLLKLSYRGIVHSALEAVPVESMTLKVVALLLMGAASVTLLYRGCVCAD